MKYSTHLASHGFIVLARKCTVPGLGARRAIPPRRQEAELAGRVLDWLLAHLASFVGICGRGSISLACAGHSRGGRVAWPVLLSDHFPRESRSRSRSRGWRSKSLGRPDAGHSGALSNSIFRRSLLERACRETVLPQG